MIRITLTDDEMARLEQAFRTSDNPRIRPRVQAVLMAYRGRPHPQIAQDLAVNQRTLQRWLNAYNQGGLDAVVTGKDKGAKPRLTAELAPVLRQWVIDGPTEQGLNRANWTHEELADHLSKTRGILVKKSALQAFCRKPEIRPYRPSYRFLRGDPTRQAEAKVELAALKGAEEGKLVLLCEDEARFPMVPTMCRTLGVKGHRPVVGTWDCKDLLYVSASVNTITGQLVSNTLESPANARRKTGQSKTRRMQEAFADHLRHVARAYPKDKHRRVVLIIDNAPWPRGKLIDEALTANPPLEFERLPSYSPQLNVIERFWKLLRRRATHNRLFADLAKLNGSLRASLSYYQTVKKKVCRLIAECYAPPVKSTDSFGS